MIEFTIIGLVSLALCQAFPNPSDSNYPHFPYLKTVDHGHGATSYQNVNVDNFLSVPIPKDLQVDDGREYEIQREYFEDTDDEDHDRHFSLDSRHYLDADVNIEHVIVATEDAKDLDDNESRSDQRSQDEHVPGSNDESYAHEIKYEYH